MYKRSLTSLVFSCALQRQRTCWLEAIHQKQNKTTMKTRGILFIAVLLLATLNMQAQNPNFYIYVCFGQSNMEGVGPIEPQDQIVNERFKTLQAIDCPDLNRVKGKWYPAEPPTCQCYSKLSPADYFGRMMVEILPDSITIGIINVAIGGCDIRIFDKDIYADYDSTYKEKWFTDKVAYYEGNPYQYLINLAKMAQKDGVIKGILLHQGESNTGDEAWPSYVMKIYNDMVNDLSLSRESVPLLAGEVLQTGNNCCEKMNPIINKLPQVMPNAYIISSEGCEGLDYAHFTSEGYRIIGKRYAKQMLTLMGYSMCTPK